MKKFTIEVSHAEPGQLASISAELKIMSNSWERFGPRIFINEKRVQPPSLRIPGTGPRRKASSLKPGGPAHKCGKVQA
tara:strand:- start:459 stop:692 length:234 start_codon:yes stop_codon:yes gene_type:complete